MSKTVCFFIGEDSGPKEKKIAALRQKWLSSADAVKLDYEVHDASKIDPRALQETLLGLPAVASRKVVLLKNCHRLDKKIKEILLSFAQSPSQYIILILDAERLSLTDAFVKKIKPQADLFSTTPPQKQNVFDMTQAISSRQPAAALKILSHLLREGDQPLQIMGALVWFWRKIQNRLPAVRYEQGLKFLQEADLNIKRSRIRPDYALELVVVKLSGLMT